MNHQPSRFLAAIHRRTEEPPSDAFPWSLPLVLRLESLEFPAPVTFLVGENGSGKSTLLEGLAAGMDAVAVGQRDLQHDETLAAARSFASGFRFVRRQHAKTRLFLRAEDVFGFTQRVAREMDTLREMEEGFRRELPEGWGQQRAMGVARGQRRALAARYGDDPDARSHGETFLSLLHTRLVPNGLYFLDEPETPLSPTRVLSLIALLNECVRQGCQFIIATHSPILMAVTDATILRVAEVGVERVAYDDVEHVRVTRDFLNNPAAFLRHL